MANPQTPDSKKTAQAAPRSPITDALDSAEAQLVWLGNRVRGLKVLAEITKDLSQEDRDAVLSIIRS